MKKQFSLGAPSNAGAIAVNPTSTPDAPEEAPKEFFPEVAIRGAAAARLGKLGEVGDTIMLEMEVKIIEKKVSEKGSRGHREDGESIDFEILSVNLDEDGSDGGEEMDESAEQAIGRYRSGMKQRAGESEEE